MTPSPGACGKDTPCGVEHGGAWPGPADRAAPWLRLLRVLLPALLALSAFCTVIGASSAWAQDGAVDARLDAARQRMEALQRQTAKAGVSALPALRGDALDVQQQTAAVAEELAPLLANVEARLAQLGAAPAPPLIEAPDVAEQRAALVAERSRLDAQLRLARLLATEGGQLAEQVAVLRRERFEAQLGERTASVLSPSFWTETRETWPRDGARLAALLADVGRTARATPVWAWALALLASFTAGLAAWRIWHWLPTVLSTRVPHGRLRRSLLALGRTLLPPAAVLAASAAVRAAMLAGGTPAPGVDTLLLGLAGAVGFGTYVAALGHALMAPSRPSWRLPPLPDLMAQRLRHDPLWLGLAIAAIAALSRLAATANAALATAVAISCLYSLGLIVLLVRTLRRAELARREVLASPRSGQVPPRSLPVLLVVVAGWGVLVVGLAGLLLGYVALGSFLVRQVAWIIVVLASAYLLAAVIDDVCTTWLGAAHAGSETPRHPQAGDAADPAAQDSLPPTLRRQAAVLVSASLRVVVALLALSLVVGPLGQGPSELLQRAGALREGITVGEIRIDPFSVAQALLIFAGGVAAVRALQAWLLDRYLPTTRLDAGMRSSTATLLGYMGIVVVLAVALSAIGLGLERVAWVASALSVGIGFGLQAVVSNFVSGLILLTERPVKVGDWVSVSGVEGDIRRINVRATEIQMGDRSTLIVPNTEFITKIVRNITHANALGLVQVKLPLPLDADVLRVRELLLQVLRDNPDVLETPEPSVLLDAVDAASLMFVATGSVPSPRQVGNVRSALLFEMLAQLKAAGLQLSRQPTLLLREGDRLGGTGTGTGTGAGTGTLPV